MHIYIFTFNRKKLIFYYEIELLIEIWLSVRPNFVDSYENFF